MRRVRTLEGARFYNLPIGSPITKDVADAAKAAAALKGVAAPKGALTREKKPAPVPAGAPGAPGEPTGMGVASVTASSISGPAKFHVEGVEFSAPSGSVIFHSKNAEGVTHVRTPDGEIHTFNKFGEIDTQGPILEALKKKLNDPNAAESYDIQDAFEDEDESDEGIDLTDLPEGSTIQKPDGSVFFTKTADGWKASAPLTGLVIDDKTAAQMVGADDNEDDLFTVHPKEEPAEAEKPAAPVEPKKPVSSVDEAATKRDAYDFVWSAVSKRKNVKPSEIKQEFVEKYGDELLPELEAAMDDYYSNRKKWASKNETDLPAPKSAEEWETWLDEQEKKGPAFVTPEKKPEPKVQEKEKIHYDSGEVAPKSVEGKSAEELLKEFEEEKAAWTKPFKAELSKDELQIVEAALKEDLFKGKPESEKPAESDKLAKLKTTLKTAESEGKKFAAKKLQLQIDELEGKEKKPEPKPEPKPEVKMREATGEDGWEGDVASAEVGFAFWMGDIVPGKSQVYKKVNDGPYGWEYTDRYGKKHLNLKDSEVEKAVGPGGEGDFSWVPQVPDDYKPAAPEAPEKPKAPETPELPQEPDSETDLGVSVKPTKAEVSEAVKAMEAHSGFQIAYGLKSVPNNPLADKGVQAEIKALAVKEHPDLTPKQAFVQYLKDKAGLADDEPQVKAVSGKMIQIGPDNPVNKTVQGYNGGTFSEDDIQEAIDLLEGFDGKAFKSHLNKNGNPLGTLNPNELVEFDKDKSVVKQRFIDFLKGELSKSKGTPSVEEPEAPAPDEMPEPGGDLTPEQIPNVPVGQSITVDGMTFDHTGDNEWTSANGVVVNDTWMASSMSGAKLASDDSDFLKIGSFTFIKGDKITDKEFFDKAPDGTQVRLAAAFNTGEYAEASHNGFIATKTNGEWIDKWGDELSAEELADDVSKGRAWFEKAGSPVVSAKDADDGDSVRVTDVGNLKEGSTFSVPPAGDFTVMGEDEFKNDSGMSASLEALKALSDLVDDPIVTVDHVGDGQAEDPAPDAVEWSLDEVFQEIDNTTSLETPSKPIVSDFTLVGAKKTGGQGGSNEGGTYEVDTPDGPVPMYVKTAQTDNHGRNEALANALYADAGVAVPTVTYNPANKKIFSPIISGKQDMKDRMKNDPEWMSKVRRDFAVDAWLGNWDFAGLVWDNIITADDGTPHRIDNGGSLLYRAQGDPKGKLFGDKVTELDTFTKPGIGNAHQVFKDMTEEEELDGVQRVLNITPDQIKARVAEAGMDPSLADTLIARRQDIYDRYKDNAGITLAEEEKGGLPEPTVPETTETPSAAAPSPFTILPKAQRGESGDKKILGKYWGKFGAAGLIVRAKDKDGQQKFLVAQRALEGTSNAGKWQLPGGAIDEHETPHQGVAREFAEEVIGADAQLSKLVHKGDHVNEPEDGQGWKYTSALADLPETFDAKPADWELNELKWVTADELLAMRDNNEMHPELQKPNALEALIQGFDVPEKDLDSTELADDLPDMVGDNEPVNAPVAQVPQQRQSTLSLEDFNDLPEDHAFSNKATGQYMVKVGPDDWAYSPSPDSDQVDVLSSADAHSYYAEGGWSQTFNGFPEPSESNDPHDMSAAQLDALPTDAAFFITDDDRVLFKVGDGWSHTDTDGHMTNFLTTSDAYDIIHAESPGTWKNAPAAPDALPTDPKTMDPASMPVGTKLLASNNSTLEKTSETTWTFTSSGTGKSFSSLTDDDVSDMMQDASPGNWSFVSTSQAPALKKGDKITSMDQVDALPDGASIRFIKKGEYDPSKGYTITKVNGGWVDSTGGYSVSDFQTDIEDGRLYLENSGAPEAPAAPAAPAAPESQLVQGDKIEGWDDLEALPVGAKVHVNYNKKYEPGNANSVLTKTDDKGWYDDETGVEFSDSAVASYILNNELFLESATPGSAPALKHKKGDPVVGYNAQQLDELPEGTKLRTLGTDSAYDPNKGTVLVKTGNSWVGPDKFPYTSDAVASEVKSGLGGYYFDSDVAAPQATLSTWKGEIDGAPVGAIFKMENSIDSSKAPRLKKFGDNDWSLINPDGEKVGVPQNDAGAKKMVEVPGMWVPSTQAASIEEWDGDVNTAPDGASYTSPQGSKLIHQGNGNWHFYETDGTLAESELDNEVVQSTVGDKSFWKQDSDLSPVGEAPEAAWDGNVAGAPLGASYTSVTGSKLTKNGDDTWSLTSASGVTMEHVYTDEEVQQLSETDTWNADLPAQPGEFDGNNLSTAPTGYKLLNPKTGDVWTKQANGDWESHNPVNGSAVTMDEENLQNAFEAGILVTTDQDADLKQLQEIADWDGTDVASAPAGAKLVMKIGVDTENWSYFEKQKDGSWLVTHKKGTPDETSNAYTGTDEELQKVVDGGALVKDLGDKPEAGKYTKDGVKSYYLVNDDGDIRFVSSKGNVYSLTPEEMQQKTATGWAKSGDLDGGFPEVGSKVDVGGAKSTVTKKKLADLTTLSDGSYKIGTKTITVTNGSATDESGAVVPLTKFKTHFNQGKVVDSSGTSVLPDNYSGPLMLTQSPTSTAAVVGVLDLLDDPDFFPMTHQGQAKLNEVGMPVNSNSLFWQMKEDLPELMAGMTTYGGGTLPDGTQYGSMSYDKNHPVHQIAKDYLRKEITDKLLPKMNTDVPASVSASLFDWEDDGVATRPASTYWVGHTNGLDNTELGEKVKEISAQFGNGKVLSPPGTKYDRRKWLTAYADGNFKQMYDIEVSALKAKGKTHPGVLLHPGAPNNPETHSVDWASPVKGEISASKTIDGTWSGMHVNQWSMDEVNNYLIAAKMQNPQYLSSSEKRTWVMRHKSGDTSHTAALSAEALARKQGGKIAPLSEPISWSNSVVPATTYSSAFDDAPGGIPSADAWNALNTGAAIDWASDNWVSPEFQKYLKQSGSPVSKAHLTGSHWGHAANEVKAAVSGYWGEKHQAYMDELNKPVYQKTSNVTYGDTPVMLLTDQFGRQKGFKPIQPGQEHAAELESAATSLARMWGFQTPSVAVAKPLDDEAEGSMFELVAAHEGSLAGSDMKNLTPSQIGQLGSEHVLDWMLDNHGSNSDNVLIQSNGRLLGTNKGGSFQSYGGWDGLSADSGKMSANSSHDSVYGELFDKIRNGTISQEQANEAYKQALRTAKRIAGTKDAKVEELVRQGLQNRTDWTADPLTQKNAPGKHFPNNTDAVVNAVLDRKSKLVNDVEAMWDKVFKASPYDKPEIPAKALGEGHQSGWDEADLIENIQAKKVWGQATMITGAGVMNGQSKFWSEERDDGSTQIRGQMNLDEVMQQKFVNFLQTKATKSTAASDAENVSGFPPTKIPFKRPLRAAAKDATAHAHDKQYDQQIWDEFEAAVDKMAKDSAVWSPSVEASNGQLTVGPDGKVTFPSGLKVEPALLPQYGQMLLYYQDLADKCSTGKANGESVDKTPYEDFQPTAGIKKKIYTSPDGQSHVKQLTTGSWLMASPDGVSVTTQRPENTKSWDGEVEPVSTDPVKYDLVSSYEYKGSLGANGVKKVSDDKFGSGYGGNSSNMGQTGDQYEMHLPTGEIISFRNGSTTNTKQSQKGLLKYKLVVGDEQASMQRVKDHLQTMGLSFDGTTEDTLRLSYWRSSFTTVLTRVAGSGGSHIDAARTELLAKYKGVRSDIETTHGVSLSANPHEGVALTQVIPSLSYAMTPEEELDYLEDLARKTWGSAKVDELISNQKFMPTYQRMNLGDTESGVGTALFERLDQEDEIEALKKKGYMLACGTNADEGPDAVLQAFINSGGMLSTEERFRVLGTQKNGMSSPADQNTGGANSNFLRISAPGGGAETSGAYFGSHIAYWNMDALKYNSTFSFAGDKFGETSLLSSLAPYKASGVKGFTENTNETCTSDALSIFEFMEILVFKSQQERQKAIARMKELGIEELRGIPIEERLVMRQDLKAAMDKVRAQWK